MGAPWPLECAKPMCFKTSYCSVELLHLDYTSQQMCIISIYPLLTKISLPLNIVQINCIVTSISVNFLSKITHEKNINACHHHDQYKLHKHNFIWNIPPNFYWYKYNKFTSTHDNGVVSTKYNVKTLMKAKNKPSHLKLPYAGHPSTRIGPFHIWSSSFARGMHKCKPTKLLFLPFGVSLLLTLHTSSCVLVSPLCYLWRLVQLLIVVWWHILCYFLMHFTSFIWHLVHHTTLLSPCT